MLYDQALYVIACLEAYQVTGDEAHARNAREVLAYVTRDMTSVTGGFYSAEDADSEGEEGKFYTWKNAEVLEVLGPEDGEFFLATYRFQDEGNFLEEKTHAKNGTNIPHLRSDLTEEERSRLEPIRQKLWEHRETRVHPQKDDKILTDWNGLMISAYARAAQVLGDEADAAIATKAADFVLSKLATEDGRLLKRYRQGEAGLTAHLEDYAFLIRGLLDLYETTFEVRYLRRPCCSRKRSTNFSGMKKRVVISPSPRMPRPSSSVRRSSMAGRSRVATPSALGISPAFIA
jgi:uncharacterized protein YyaL (SSP411 family)